MENVAKLLDQIEVLPPSPALLSKLLLAINDVDTNFDEVVNFIEVDPSLTAKLLQICNSAFFGATEPIVTVRDAVSHAGYQSIYLLIAMIQGADLFKLPAAGIDTAQLWKHSVVTAYATKFVAETAQVGTGLAFTGGLLHDLGKIVFIKANAEHYKLLLKRAAEAKKSPFEFEVSSRGFSHAEVGAALLERWELPAPLVRGVAFHHNLANAGQSQSEAACICLGNLLAHGQEYPQAAESQEYREAQEVLRLTPMQIAHCLDQVAAHMAQVEQMCWLA